MEGRSKETGDGSRHLRTALPLAAVAAGMLALAFASVPLYRLFCQVTGYGGTTQQAQSAPGAASERRITVRLDANVDPKLSWTFRPETSVQNVRIGESTLVFYRAANTTAETITGTAAFNVTPEIAGQYFSKTECFCFTEQTLEPGQSVELPVSFFIDPAILSDPDASRVQEITLSYTFFRSGTDAAAAPGQASAAGG